MNELKEILILETRLKILREEILYLETEVMKINKELSPIVVQTSHEKDSLENKIIELAEKRDKYIFEFAKYYKIREKIISKILKIKNHKEMEAVYKKYVEGKKISEICKEMELTYKWTQELLKRGINSYRNVV